MEEKTVVIEKIEHDIIFFIANGKRYKAKIIGYNKGIFSLYVFNTNSIITYHPEKTHLNNEIIEQTNDKIVSPITGRIIKIHVSVGLVIPINAPLVTIESMKMENEIRAPFELFIKSISISEGHLVKKDQVLLMIERSEKGDFYGTNSDVKKKV